MKRLRVILLTLALTVSMLAPEFAMLPAAYAEDGSPAVEQSVDGTETAGDTEDPATETTGSYDLLQMTDVYDSGGLTMFPEGMQDKITVEHSRDDRGILLTGTVADLKSTYITFGDEFCFDSGSVGRLYFDGLKDRDVGMDVEVEVYLDDGKSPIVTIPLKKQSGKNEWASKGDKSISLGTSGISGKHSVALMLNITGKKDTATTSVLLRSIRFCKTTVPVMYFNIDESQGTIEAMNNSNDHSAECYGKVDLVVPDEFNNDDTFKEEYLPQESLYGLDLEYIRGRGNSTWLHEKKPYKVKLDKAQDLFGFGKNKHWVLIANRYDNSLIRNRMTYRLGRELGMEFTPECVPVEVVMNGEFYGSYLLCEQIRLGEGRVTIDDLDDQDPLAVTDDFLKKGSFLLSMEYFTGDTSRMFSTKNGMNFYIESPEEKVDAYYEYIQAYIQKVENAIYGDGFRDADGVLYTDYLDLDAAVDYWWVQEFSSNGDAYVNGSTYLYKKKESDTEPAKLFWGPLWDFDFVAWGDLSYGMDPEGGLDNTPTPWFNMMKSDPVFLKAVKDRWQQEGGLRDKLKEITREGTESEEGGLLDKYIAQMETTYMYDHEKWGAYESEFTEYRDEVDQLRDWINKRLDLVDEAVEEISTEPHHVTFTVDGQVVSEVDIVGAIRQRNFPEDPEKPGFFFMGWVDEDGMSYKDGSRISTDLTLSAYFADESEVAQAKDIFFNDYDVYCTIDDDLGPGKNIIEPHYTIVPEDAIDTKVTWSSSDPDIAEPDKEFYLINLNKEGDVTITATLKNGVSKSFRLHIVNSEDMETYSDVVLDKTSMTLDPGEYSQVLAVTSPENCKLPELLWISGDEEVARVDEVGVVTGVAPGTTEVYAVNTDARIVRTCKVTVKGEDGSTPSDSTDNGGTPPKNTDNSSTSANNDGAVTPANQTGKTVKYKGSNYRITSDTASSKTAMLVKAKNAKTVTIPATITLNGQKYNVTKIKSKAFAKSKAKKLILKTKKLSKKSVKGSLKSSKVTKVKVSVGKKSLNNKYVKKYKKYFIKKNAGKKVKVY